MNKIKDDRSFLFSFTFFFCFFIFFLVFLFSFIHTANCHIMRPLTLFCIATLINTLVAAPVYSKATAHTSLLSQSHAQWRRRHTLDVSGDQRRMRRVTRAGGERLAIVPAMFVPRHAVDALDALLAADMAAAGPVLLVEKPLLDACVQKSPEKCELEGILVASDATLDFGSSSASSPSTTMTTAATQKMRALDAYHYDVVADQWRRVALYDDVDAPIDVHIAIKMAKSGEKGVDDNVDARVTVQWVASELGAEQTWPKKGDVACHGKKANGRRCLGHEGTPWPITNRNKDALLQLITNDVLF
ncbi:hypothetical protein BC940DRAFT_299353 [Gongronella butleri]|nr:hypothetical protein BC940DRAFT_299353 [Gongronella butleri]